MLTKLVTILFLLFTFAAQAVEVEVKVFQKGTNAMEARTKALADAEKRGFAALVKQKAPEYAEQILRDSVGVNIGQYVIGYHAKDEVVTNTSYRAILVMDFDDSFINSITQQSQPTSVTGQNPYSPHNIPEQPVATGDAILLIPVFRSRYGILLWEKGNIWRKSVNEMALQRGHGEFVVPYGDHVDKLTINASNILTASFARLAPLTRRYGANRILIAVAHGNGGRDGYTLTLRELSPTGSAIKTINIKDDPNLSSNDLLRQSAEGLIDGYLKKQHNMTPEEMAESQYHDINAYILLNNARDWGDLRKRLMSIKLIKNIQVIGADAGSMALEINFKGPPKNFGEALVNNGIFANQNNGQLWLSLR